ncbi:MAG: N-acetyltransferase [Alphaproteobacteria bacterium]|nr:N-acetyltransferase [Alphaproteobacteria bacterium]
MVKIERHTPAPLNLSDELHTKLAQAGQALLEEDVETFLFSVRDSDGELTAGCKGEIAFKSAHVSEIWVDETQRGNGIGGQLLAAAESLAHKKGCERIHLETRSERARALYEKAGYRVFGRLPNFAGDQTFYYLEKALG